MKPRAEGRMKSTHYKNVSTHPSRASLFYTLTQVSTKSQGYKNRSLFFLRCFFFPYFLLFLKIHKKLNVRYIVAQYKKNGLGVHKRSLFIV